MKHSQRLQLEQSEVREKINGLLSKNELSHGERAELDKLTKRAQEIEPELRAALVSETDGAETRETPTDPETRERIELRNKASLGRYLIAGMRGGRLDRAEAELAEAAGVSNGQIPLELWDVPREARTENGTEERAVTAAPATVGVNFDTLRPMVFAPSVVDKLIVEMPQVESGTYATGTITTAATADAVAKGADTCPRPPGSSRCQPRRRTAWAQASISLQRTSRRLGGATSRACYGSISRSCCPTNSTNNC